MSVTVAIRRHLRRLGFDVVRYSAASHPLARRKRLLDVDGISVVLDVGAHIGQYAEQLRSIGYAGRIVSFEPMTAAHEVLAAKANNDDLWQTHPIALGDRNGVEQLNIAGNSQSSSILDMRPRHAQAAPESAYVDRQPIEVRRLDSLFDWICAPDDRVFLKIDTQGYERYVLDGARACLARVATLQLEMSLMPLYEGELSADDLHRLLDAEGFRLVGLEPGFADESTGELLQVDGIFQRAPAAAEAASPPLRVAS